jgi:DNA-binding transcriptional MerR regulator
MKTDAVLLTLSLALNVALGVFVLSGFRSPPSGPATFATPAVVPAPRQASVPDAAVWQRLETPAAADLVARLRAAGFPTDVIRAILDARFEEELSARIKALDPESSRRPFWKSSQQNPQVLATMGRLRREHEKQMRALLGEQVGSTQLLNQVLPGRRVDGLPPEKAAAVMQVIRDFEEKRAEFFADPLYTLNPERRTALEREQHAALAGLLTPQELEEFDLRNSNVATSMRMQLGAFEPTDDEFRSIFRLKNEFAQQYGSTLPAGATAEQVRARQEADRRVADQIQAALGPVRGEEYTRKADFTYVQTSKIIERLQLPRENTDSVMAVGRDIAARARALETDRSLPEPSRTAQKAALYEEAGRRLTPLLGGSTGLEVYRQYGGTWLEAIKPRPPSAAPGTTPPRP